MPEVEVRKYVHIIVNMNLYNNINGQNNVIDYNVNGVNFTPDEVIVREINYVQDTSLFALIYLYTDLVNDYIGTILDGQANNINIPFKLNGMVNGSYKLYVRDSTQSQINGLDGDLYIRLEFVKYKQKGKIL